MRCSDEPAPPGAGLPGDLLPVTLSFGLTGHGWGDNQPAIIAAFLAEFIVDILA
jgi:hypothetical protein